MDNEVKIMDLIFNGAGKAAPNLTHDLRVIGNGDMAEGIAQIADFAARSGFETGHFSGMKKGVCIGLAMAAVGYGVSKLCKRYNQKVVEQATMWQRFDDDCRASEKVHWAEYEELKAKAAQEPSEEETEEIVS